MKLFPKIWRKEFSLNSLTMKHDKPSDFYTSQWQQSTTVNVYYMIFRIAMAIIFSVTMVLSIVDLNEVDKSAEERAKWLIYLTHWGYAVCCLQSILSAYMVTYMFIKVRKRNEMNLDTYYISPKLYATYWVLFNIATDAAFAITCIYWALIFDVKQHPVDVMNIFVHGMNSVLMLMDLFVVAHPVRLLHCYWSFLFATVYVTFNIIYFLAGGTDKNGMHYIYNILDWKKPGRSALVTFLAVNFVVLLHLLTYCLFLLRKHIYNTRCKLSSDINSLALTNETKDRISDQSNFSCHQSEYL